jgi:hypothetical protein
LVIVATHSVDLSVIAGHFLAGFLFAPMLHPPLRRRAGDMLAFTLGMVSDMVSMKRLVSQLLLLR